MENLRDKNNFSDMNKVMDLSEFEQKADCLISDDTDSGYALVCMNLGNIGFISSVFGVTAAGKVSEYIRNTLVNVVGSYGIVSGFSYENLLFMVSYSSKDEIILMTEKVRILSEKVIADAGYDFTVNILFGIYTFIRSSDDCFSSVSEAADRLSAAIGRTDISDGYFFYDSKIHDKVTRDIEIVKSLDAAMENNEFQIYLQPQHYLQHEDRVLSAEALVRWIKPDGSMVCPGDFIPVLEKNGLITKLDCHVMELTCRFISEHLNDEWFRDIVIAVNVSKVDLKLRDFIEYYTEVRNKYNIPDGRIEIEFTESAVFEDYTIFKQIMFELRNSGFSCSIDDFGTGSSSLNMLKSMPADVLKMDRMFFVCDNEKDQERNNSVIASVVAMARGLGMKIVAEGIETPESIDFLRKIGCDIIQGYVYSKPLSTSEFEKYVKNYIPKFLPVSEKLNPAAPHKYDVSDAESVYQKYVQVLPYVNALVIETDIEADTYSIVSFGQDEYFIAENEGNYSTFFDSTILGCISPDFAVHADEKISLKGILAAFYRGDSEIEFEMQMKLFDNDEGKLSDDYSWCLFHLYFQKMSKHSKPVATIFITNIQHQKEQELSVISIQSRLKAAIRSMRCDIYDLDLSAGMAYLLHDGSSIGKSDSGSGFEIGGYIRNKVHAEDRGKLENLISDEGFNKTISEFIGNDYYTEYRVMTHGESYRWKSIHVMPDSQRGEGVAVAIIQDITSHKKLEEKAISTEQTLHKFVSAMCACVFEINLKTSKVQMIKADSDFSLLEKTVTDIEAYDEYIRKLIREQYIHPDDAKMFENMFVSESILSELDKNGSMFIEYRRMTSEGYRWFELRLIRNGNSGIFFICNIDERKISELRKERKSRTDAVTGVYLMNDFYDIVQEFTEREGCVGEHITVQMSISDYENIRKRNSVEYGMQMEIGFVSCMRKSIRKDDIIGKSGDGKFVLFLKNIGREYAERFVSKTRSIFEQFSDENAEYRHFSAGISLLKNGDKDIRQMLYEAENANEEAKKNGQDSMKIFGEN